MSLAPATRWPRPLSILLVEDHRLDAELIQARLATLGCACSYSIVDSEAGLREQLANHRFDVILSDYMLPMFSGADALAIAQREAPDTPFIFVSGALGEEHAVEMLRQGATDYVVKQRLQRLPMTVKRAIEQAEERRGRLKAENTLREYEINFRQLIDTLKDFAVISLDLEGRIRSWNSAAERLLGIRADAIIGRPVATLYAHDADGDSKVRVSLEVAAQHDSHLRESWMPGRDGEQFFVSIVTTAIRDENGKLTGFSKIIRDTTEAHRAAAEMRRAKEAAEAANAAKDQFLAMLSHELRTPLTPILAVTSFMEQRVDLPPALAELLPLIRRNIEIEARLIDDLLDLSSITHNRLSLQLATLDLHDSLRPALDGARVDTADKRQHLEIRLDATQTHVDADATRLQQIVTNLLHNAVKFTPAGGRISIETFNPDTQHIVLRVSDSGIGISAAALPRIFSAFEQADGTINRQFGGLGLGLAIAHALAQKHGGSLRAESQGSGCGACFTLQLPLSLAETRPAPPAAAPQPATGRPLQILLVEDNEDTTIAVTTLLSLSGHAVETAGSLAELPDKLQARRYDLLISDLGLPDGDGVDVVRRFNATQDAPSIAMTGFGMADDIRRCRDAGFTAHLTKPVDFERLQALIRSLTLDRNG